MDSSCDLIGIDVPKSPRPAAASTQGLALAGRGPPASRLALCTHFATPANIRVEDGCRQQYKDLISRGERVREFVRLAEEGARKAEVLPGHLRETLERHRLDF